MLRELRARPAKVVVLAALNWLYWGSKIPQKLTSPVTARYRSCTLRRLGDGTGVDVTPMHQSKALLDALHRCLHIARAVRTGSIPLTMCGERALASNWRTVAMASSTPGV